MRATESPRVFRRLSCLNTDSTCAHSAVLPPGSVCPCAAYTHAGRLRPGRGMRKIPPVALASMYRVILLRRQADNHLQLC